MALEQGHKFFAIFSSFTEFLIIYATFIDGESQVYVIMSMKHHKKPKLFKQDVMN